MIEIYRTLMIPDPEAVTLKNTLIRLNYPLDGEDGLRKHEKFIIDAPAYVKKSAWEFLINPYRHFSEIRTKLGKKGYSVFDYPLDTRIIVATDDDPLANQALEVLRNRYEYGKKIKDVQRRVIWGVKFSKASKDAIQLGKEKEYFAKLAEEMGRSFFANPNFQHYQIVM